MAITVRSGIINAYTDVRANLNKVIFDEYLAEKSVHKQIFNIETTNLPMVNDEVFAGLGLFSSKKEGVAGATDSTYHMYHKNYEPITYSLLVEFSSEAIKDDRLSVIKKALAGLGQSARSTQDTLAANVINMAFTTTGPDGKVLAATDHPLYTGTARNRPTNGTAFSHTALALALVDWMTEQKNSRGIKIDSSPAYLLHPPALKLDVTEVLNSVMRSDTARNATNAIKDDFNLVPVTWKKLTDANAWALMAKPSGHGLKVIVRESFHTLHGEDGKAGSSWTRGEFRQDQGWSTWQGFWMNPGQS